MDPNVLTKEDSLAAQVTGTTDLHQAAPARALEGSVSAHVTHATIAFQSLSLLPLPKATSQRKRRTGRSTILMMFIFYSSFILLINELS